MTETSDEEWLEGLKKHAIDEALLRFRMDLYVLCMELIMDTTPENVDALLAKSTTLTTEGS